jgi:tRNA (cmo5U34)-methyltransferase
MSRLTGQPGTAGLVTSNPTMSHSVESHLRLDIAEYDELIRRFIPGYDEMLSELADYLAFNLIERERSQVLDLGTGTGSLAALVLKRIPNASVIGIDTDPAMIVEARKRLADLLPRVTHLLRDFSGPLPHGSDACMASLALHHIRELIEKRRLYRKILGALNPHGIFVNADAMFAENSPLEAWMRSAWTKHQVARGFSKGQVESHFQQWATEDRYFDVQTELNLLHDAGFSNLEVVWRRGPMAVIAGHKA